MRFSVPLALQSRLVETLPNSLAILMTLLAERFGMSKTGSASDTVLPVQNVMRQSKAAYGAEDSIDDVDSIEPPHLPPCVRLRL